MLLYALCKDKRNELEEMNTSAIETAKFKIVFKKNVHCSIKNFLIYYITILLLLCFSV